MAVYTIKEVARVVGGMVVGGGDAEVRGFSVDSRTVSPGDMFIALAGTRADGHNFVHEAARAGASAALVAKPVGGVVPCVVVEDPGAALLTLAKERRARFEGPVVAVTGSCGKTTTKDLTARVLAERFRVCVTPGNYNTEIGLPLSILALHDEDVLVLEVGVNKPGDMDVLGSVVQPDVAVLTCVAPTHTEFFGTVEGVAREKLGLLKYLRPGGTIVWNGDDPKLREVRRLARAGAASVSFGFSRSSDVFATDYAPGRPGSSFLLNGIVRVELGVPGHFNVYNALAAAAVGRVLGVDYEAAAEALHGARPAELRAEVLERDGITYILDCYNSSPAAAAAALEMLAEVGSGGRTVAVLGEMLELGASSLAEHRELGRVAAERGIDELVGVGDAGRDIVEGAKAAGFGPDSAFVFATAEETADFLAGFLADGDTVLFKASRGVRMERVAERLGIR